MAYAKENTSGISIAVADLDGDGRNEIIAMTNNVFTTSSIRAGTQQNY